MARNKALLDQYKQLKFRMGVYGIRNTANGKLFVGSGLNLDALRNRNWSELRLGGHRNEALQQEWNQYGADAFVWEVLAELEEKEGSNYAHEARQLEQFYISELQAWGDRGYHNEPRR